MHRFRIPFAATALAAVVVFLLTLGSAAATGTGYDLSFSQAPTTAISDVALIDLQSYDPGGNNITVTMTVDGTFVLNNANYSYYLFFGGGAQENATAYALWSNSTVGTYVTLQGGVAPTGPLVGTLSNGNSELSVSIAKAVVGPSTDFVENALASYTTSATSANSYLGSYYGGGGACSGAQCSTTNTSPSSFDWWIVIVPAVVAVAVVAIVLAVVLRRKPPAAGPPPPGSPPAVPAPSPPAPP
jgi:hypothetical protein